MRLTNILYHLMKQPFFLKMILLIEAGALLCGRLHLAGIRGNASWGSETLLILLLPMTIRGWKKGRRALRARLR